MSAMRRFRVGIRRGGGVCFAAMAIAMGDPAGAGAATGCSYDSAAEVLSVTMSADNDQAQLAVGPGSEIQVRGGGSVLSCAGGSATLANTEFINVSDESGSGSTRASIIQPADFGSLGIILVMGGGTNDQLYLGGSTGADHFVLGAKGIDSDADANIDVTFFVSTPEQINASGGAGGDTITGQGSAATGTPLAIFLSFTGETENDTLDGGEAGDILEGGNGNDTIRGHGGGDRLMGDAFVAGDDTLEGGLGTDTLGWPFNILNGVTIDLSTTTPQATGVGTDTITQVEDVDGTSFADTLTGDAGPNTIRAQSGDDTVDGRGGNDSLEGSIGTDTITYASAPAGVAVNLGAGTASGGDGTDTFTDFDNLVGSPFADNLTGSPTANTITALAGADLVNVRDGKADKASCGTGIDKAVSDRRSLDAIQPDCEQVDALPEPTTTVLGGANPPQDTRLDFRLSGARRQKVVQQKGVFVRVRCPEEKCTVLASASSRLPNLGSATASALTRLKIKAVTRQLPAGPAVRLKLRLNRRQRGAIQARVAVGLRPKLKVLVKATDGAGNVVPRKLTVTATL